MARAINPTPQFLDDAGDPLISGKVYFYDSGSSNPKATYSDAGLSIANTNPVILSASGRMPNVFFDGTAKVKLTSADDVQIWERDPVGSGATGAFVEWDALTSFAYNDMVEGSDNNFYIAIASNQGSDPTSSPANWSQIKFVGVWNTNETYDLHDVVQGADGLLYISLSAANIANAVTDKTKWGVSTPFRDVVFDGSLTEETYTVPDNVLNPINGTIQTKTMAADTDFSSTTTLTDGQSLTLHLLGGDVYTVTYPTITWIAGVAPVLTAKDVIEFWMVGSELFGAHVGGYT